MSDEAKDFIKKLLVMDPDKRMSAKEALDHKWLMQVIKMDMKKSRVGVTQAFKNLTQFNSDSNLKKATFSFIS